jgi:hypothetical protein
MILDGASLGPGLMDALSELLSTIRLRETTFIDACLSAPWAFETPAPEELAKRMAPDAERVIPYHMVSEGSWVAQWAGGARLFSQQNFR